MLLSDFMWDLYKESERGRNAIEQFHIKHLEDCYGLYLKFSVKAVIDKGIFLDVVDDVYSHYASDKEVTSKIEARKVFMSFVHNGLMIDGEECIPPHVCDFILGAITPISIAFYLAHDFYFPNFFQYNAYLLKKIADTFEIELPKYPKKSDREARCEYYADLCDVFYDFRIKNNLSKAELCAFLFDYAPEFISKSSDEIPKPTNAWFIGGVLENEDKNYDFISCWQVNAETKKGDILIQYETSPISAITAIRIATTDGIVDPFFHYYTWAHMSRYMPTPSLSLNELRTDKYFSQHPLVRKNFQGVNGWQLTGSDYCELMRLFEEKGCEISKFPQIYTPKVPDTDDIKYERDVELKLLEFYLSKLGYVEGVDYVRQLPIHAGRGHRIYPDYALHYDDKQNYEKAQILIEVKLEIKNNADLEAAFCQAYSYAKLLESSVIVICDRLRLIIYQNKGCFDRDAYTTIYWSELCDPQIYNRLKHIMRKNC